MVFPALARPLLLSSPMAVSRRSSATDFDHRNFKNRVSDNSNEHYFSRNSLKYWDKFYKLHRNKFFKDRHYLVKDWGRYFSENDDDGGGVNGKVLLEIGCGTGNTTFPLIAAYPKLFVHACDFSTEALALVKSHPNFNEEQIHLFICDVASNELCDKILPSSVDVVTLIFMLSAVSPNKMPFVLQNLKKILKPNGHILVRDYAVGDSAQCSFYFSEDFLSNLFARAGFDVVDINIYCRQIENRFRNMTFQRRWIRAIFKISDCKLP